MEGCAERGDCWRIGMEARVLTYLRDCSEHADSAELFEDVGVAEDDGFEGGWKIFGLVCLDRVEDCWNFSFGKACVCKDRGASFRV